MASKESSAPATLVRLILARGPLSEKEIINRILILATFSSDIVIHFNCYSIFNYERNNFL